MSETTKRNITAIVPLDLVHRPLDIISKARQMAMAANRANVKIIFAHNDRGMWVDRLFKLVIRKCEGAFTVSKPFYTGNVNAALLRNEAFKHVTDEFLTLLDVDIWPDFALIEKYRDKVDSQERPFYMLPCLYLTKKGSRDLTRSKIDVKQLTQRFFNFSRKEFLHLASPSSVIVMRSKDYSLLKGFNEAFSGHGYEDFDFMMRLADLHGASEKSPDMLLDKTARSPLFARGFRRYLGENCFEALLEKDLAFHIFHERPDVEGYQAARKKNYELFASLHKHKVLGTTVGDPTLISGFSRLCAEKNIDVSDYGILFDNKPGHIDRFDTFRRRLRFLLNE
ncbi:galactosyltransferase-related protein [Pseudomonas sp. GL-B-19]|uniref:galactosyltransferase-related protein n=1 Tax=Pseudomonas sp. GL-B-19 TaxID=2832393 RepID=UPI001CBBE1CD|nr:galactosyltransferase-related protein [Pseudomonas sp. GL-B-19]